MGMVEVRWRAARSGRHVNMGAMRVSSRRLALADIDAAGIAFSGRLVVIALEALEAGLSVNGLDFATLIRERRYGVPLVHLEADFRHPLRHGDPVELDLVCERIGEHSYTCRVDLVQADGTVAAQVRFVAAVVDMATFRATAVPPAMRAALERLMAPAG